MLRSLRLHYDALAAEKYGYQAPVVRRVPGSVLGCVAHAHRKALNQKLVLPDEVKAIFRCPRDEINPAKLELLVAAVRHEVEGQTLVYLRTEDDIKSLAKAVESCTSPCADEVGEAAAEIPAGARPLVEVPADLTLDARRKTVAGLVRSMQAGDPVLVKMRPLETKRKPPLDAFARELMLQPHRSLRELTGKRQVEEMRDRLLLCLYLKLLRCQRVYARLLVALVSPFCARGHTEVCGTRYS